MAQNSFAGTNLRVGNQGVRSVIDEAMSFRTQVTRTDEVRQVGGWGDPLNQILSEGLGRIRKTLALVTYQQRQSQDTGQSGTDSSAGQREREAAREGQAVDEDLKLRELFGESRPLSVDDTQMPASHQSQLPYDFSGANKNFPQLSDQKFQNIFLRQFVSVLDMLVRDASTLACAEYGYTIPTRQSVMLHNHLETAFAILQHKGGAARAPHIVNGTDPESLLGKVGPSISDVVIADPIPELASDSAQG